MTERMKWVILVIFLLNLVTGATAQEELSENLKSLQPFIGKTWRGELKGSSQDKPMIDVARWERALNGQAVRVLHSVNNGDYGGESLIFWDNQKKSVVYYYFTTAGFFTQGTMKLENGKYSSHEYVSGNEEGITEVKATAEITPEGKMITKSEYLKNGKWVPGHGALYMEDPSAQVVFK